jgi:hypothetical protein
MATILSAGDAAIVAYNGDAGSLTVVFLKPVTAGTKIVLTNRSWNGTVFSAAAGEGVLELTIGPVDFGEGLAVSFTAAQLASAGIALSPAGETLYLYQGSTADAPDRFVFALDIGDGDATFGGSLANTGLSPGAGALAIAADNAAFASRFGAVQDALLKAELADASAWVSDDSGSQPLITSFVLATPAPDLQLWVAGAGGGDAIITADADPAATSMLPGTIAYRILHLLQDDAGDPLYRPQDIALDTVHDRFFVADADANGHNRIVQGSISALLANPGAPLDLKILYSNAGTGYSGIIHTLSVDTVNQKIYFDENTRVQRIGYDAEGQTPAVLADLYTAIPGYGAFAFINQISIDYASGTVWLASSYVDRVGDDDFVPSNRVFSATAGSAAGLAVAGGLIFAPVLFAENDTTFGDPDVPSNGLDHWPKEKGAVVGVDVNPASGAVFIVTRTVALDTSAAQDNSELTTFYGGVFRYDPAAATLTEMFRQDGVNGPIGELSYIEADAATGRYYVSAGDGVWAGSLATIGAPVLFAAIGNGAGLEAAGLEIQHAPTLAASALAATVTETPGNPSPLPAGVKAATGFVAQDADSGSDPLAQLAGAQVRVAENFRSGAGHQDILTVGSLESGTFTSTSGQAIVFAYDRASGVMTLTGAATRAAYQEALEQVRFTVAGDNPDDAGAATSRTLAYAVFDGLLYSDEVEASIAVAAVNDAPTAAFAGVQSARFGGETPVGTVAGAGSSDVSITGLAGGGHVVAWTQTPAASGSPYSIKAQVYDASGSAVGGVLPISNTTGYYSDATVAALPSGGFVVSWASYTGVYAQRYDAAGGKVGNEILVLTSNNNEELLPVVASLSGGGFVVAWQYSFQDGSARGDTAIMARRYDATGAIQGATFRVNTFTANAQQNVSAAGLADGGYVITWESLQQDGYGAGVYGQRFNAAGVAQGAEFRINTTTVMHQTYPVVTGLTGGGFVVAWVSTQTTINDLPHIYAQRYDASGNAIGTEFRVSSANTPSFSYPGGIAALSDGGFVVTWNSLNGSNTYAHRYDAAGQPVGAEMLVNIDSAPWEPVVAGLANGDFVVGWSAYSGPGVFTQRYTSGLVADERFSLPLDGNILIGDVDSGSGLITVTISVGHGVIDRLQLNPNPATLTGSGTSTVTITGTVADVKALLAGDSVLFYSPLGDAPPPHTILNVHVEDAGYSGTGGPLMADSSIVIGITPVNDKPVLGAPTNGAIGFTEGDGPLALMQGVAVSDPDLPANFAGGSFTLSVTGSTGALQLRPGSAYQLVGPVFGGAYDVMADVNGALVKVASLSGAGTRSVSVYLGSAVTPAIASDLVDEFVFADLSENPAVGSRTVTLSFSDGGNSGILSSAAATRTQTINVTPVNDPPTISSAGGSGYEDNGRIYVWILGADVDSATLTYTITSLPEHGLLYGAGTGGAPLTIGSVLTVLPSGHTSAYFEPDPNWSGATSYGFTLSDGTASVAGTAPITVVASNDAPVVSQPATVYAVEQTAVALLTGVTVSDLELGARNGGAGDYSGASVTISRGPANAQDQFALVAGADFTIEGNLLKANGLVFGAITANGAGTLTITFTGAGTPATSALVNQVVQSVRYTNTSDAPLPDFHLSVSMNDGGADNTQGAYGAASGSKLVLVNMMPVNDIPVVTTSAGQAAFVEGSNAPSVAVAIDPGLTIFDLDDVAFSTATVSISAGREAGQDVLSFTNDNASLYGNIASVIINGALTLYSNGITATTAQWQAALRAVKFTSLSQDPSPATRTISFTLNDGDGNSVAATRQVTVAPRNDPPSATDKTLAVGEDGEYIFTVADFGFSDPEGHGFSHVLFTAPPTGGQIWVYNPSGSGGAWYPINWDGLATISYTISFVQQGWISFRPSTDLNGTGAATVKFSVGDNGPSGPGNQWYDPTPNTFTFNIAAVNDAPAIDLNGVTAGPHGFSYTENGSTILIAPSAIVLDVDSANLDQGQLMVTTGASARPYDRLVIVPQGNGPTDINVIAEGITYGGTLIATVNPGPADTLVLTLNANATPTAVQALLRSVGYWAETEAPTESGARAVSFTLSDGDGGTSAAATAMLTFAGVDDAGVARSDAGTTAENSVLTGNVFADNGSGADSDVDTTPLVVAAVNGIPASVGQTVTLNSGAKLTLNANGSYSYDPNGAFTTLTNPDGGETGAVNTAATDSFTYTLVAGGTATVTVTITGVAGPGDWLVGDGTDNVITGTGSIDVIDLRGGGEDRAESGAGNDGFLMGATLSAGDYLDGGAGTNDQLILQGDYSAPTTLGADVLRNIEVLSILSGTDTLFGGTGTDLFSYNLKTADANVAAGARLTVDFTNLVAGENVTFDGSAETNGAFTIGGGKGEDHLTGGSGADLFLFRDQERYGANDMVDGGAGNDELALRGNYSGASAIAFKANTMVNIEVISILSGNSNWWGPIIGDLGYDLTMHDNNVAAGKRLVVDAGQLSAGEVLKFNGAAELDGFFIVAGGAAADTITGGAGNDTLIGGLGADDLKGGLGNDSFRYRSVAESTVASADEILDFRSGDRIDLTLVDANSIAANDQAFTYIGSGAFTNVAGQLRAVETSANQWTVSADVDGDGHADFQILVSVADGHDLAAGDFLP